MQTQSEQVTFLSHVVLLPALKHEHGLTRRVIEAIPLDKGDYRPDSTSRSALELAWHIASAEICFMDGVASGEFSYGAFAQPETVRNSAEVSRWYAEAFTRNFDRLAVLSPEQLLKVMDYRRMFQVPAVVYLEGAKNHSIHHRGQLSMYLRPMGAKVPSIYGESFADAEARKAVQGA